jgi:hypothetical protein
MKVYAKYASIFTTNHLKMGVQKIPKMFCILNILQAMEVKCEAFYLNITLVPPLPYLEM